MKKEPLCSIILLTYNHEKYVHNALISLIEQDYNNIEIIVSDDCSPDNTWKIIKEIYNSFKEKRKIIINRNRQNLGLIQNLNKSLEMCSGEYIILHGGDDISYKNRVTKIINAFSRDKNITAVVAQSEYIDNSNKIIGSTKRGENIYTLDDEYIKSLSFMLGMSGLSIKRKVYEIFGPFLNTTPTEDSTFRLRAILLGKIYESPDILLKYRVHKDSLSYGENIYKLSTNLIAKQYVYDIKLSLKLGIIKYKQYYRLINKTILYKIDRIISKSKSKYKKNRFCRIPFRLLQEINKCFIRFI